MVQIRTKFEVAPFAMPAAAHQRQNSDVPQTGEDARRAIRSGEWTGPTSGLAPGYVQGNLAILPAALASDFMRFCQLNPKPCPLLAAGAPGDPRLPSLGRDLDIRTDLCRYKVFRNGELVDEPTDIEKHWRDDLVIFALGCSFSFEDALIQDGIELRHITNGTHRADVSHHDARRAPAGPFHGPMVVSMRPLKPADAIRAVQITTRFPAVHGAPVHLGMPELIGIKDIMKPDYGDPRADERRRDAGVLGLRGDAAIGGRDREAGVLHHALSGLHAGHRPQEFGIRDHVTRLVRSQEFARDRRPFLAAAVVQRFLAVLRQIAPDTSSARCARA